jgi:hypothetical protein
VSCRTCPVLWAASVAAYVVRGRSMDAEGVGLPTHPPDTFRSTRMDLAFSAARLAAESANLALRSCAATSANRCFSSKGLNFPLTRPVVWNADDDVDR